MNSISTICRAHQHAAGADRNRQLLKDFRLVHRVSFAAIGLFVFACAYLVVRRKIPRHLMALMRDAHEHRSVLRQAGSVYQFRHIDLQRHLAQ
ncbi:hypothetical protein AB0H67_41965 [Streptomyces phaeochromogenes]|uniref:hypothetical protein n=1 Tax=Streptomyces phaeochromogenes TaxID=1923 RepID=UPI0033C373FA